MSWIKIITLNTWKGDGLYNERLALMAGQLKVLQPDILCLQESLQSLDTELDTASTLARHLDMQCIFTPARKKFRLCEGKELLCYSGLAILTFFEVLDQQVTSLPVDNDDPDRIAMNVLLNIQGTPWVITNLHLTHLQNREQLRLQQLQAMAESPFGHGSTKPRIICGDFNCGRESWEFKQWRSTSEYEIIDCYTSGKGELPGNTFTASDGKSKCIDFILALRQQTSPTFFTQKAQVVVNQPAQDGLLPSDHFGVCVEMDCYS